MTYQAREVLVPDGKTAELLALLERSQAAMKAGPDLYHAALGWCQAQGKQDMAHAVMLAASERFPNDLVSGWVLGSVGWWQSHSRHGSNPRASPSLRQSGQLLTSYNRHHAQAPYPCVWV